jgi:hypothetical protein
MYELFTGRLLAFRGEFLNADESAVENYVMARAHVSDQCMTVTHSAGEAAM